MRLNSIFIAAICWISPIVSAQTAWVQLPKLAVDAALASPTQDNDWDCAPTSLFKAFVMQRVNVGAYEAFRDNCPRTLGSEPLCKEVAEALSTAFIGVSKVLNAREISPYAECLADYANSHGTGLIAQNYKVSAQLALTMIKEDLNEGRPVLALMERERLLHYVVVHGYNELTQEIKYIDTDNQEQVMVYSDFTKQMNMNRYREGVSIALRALKVILNAEQKETFQGVLSGHNIIRFQSSCLEPKCFVLETYKRRAVAEAMRAESDLL